MFQLKLNPHGSIKGCEQEDASHPKKIHWGKKQEEENRRRKSIEIKKINPNDYNTAYKIKWV